MARKVGPRGDPEGVGAFSEGGRQQVVLHGGRRVPLAELLHYVGPGGAHAKAPRLSFGHLTRHATETETDMLKDSKYYTNTRVVNQKLSYTSMGHNKPDYLGNMHTIRIIYIHLSMQMNSTR
eukprot:scaffold252566_cov17-Prasinocladus_malaysianus.AAC.1